MILFSRRMDETSVNGFALKQRELVRFLRVNRDPIGVAILSLMEEGWLQKHHKKWWYDKGECIVDDGKVSRLNFMDYLAECSAIFLCLPTVLNTYALEIPTMTRSPFCGFAALTGVHDGDLVAPISLSQNACRENQVIIPLSSYLF